MELKDYTTEELKMYGFGVNDTSLFGETFETVDELIEFAQKEYDNENSDYFDDEDQHCILVNAVKCVSLSTLRHHWTTLPSR